MWDSEWIIDAGENGRSLAAPANIDETDHERLSDPANPYSTDRMKRLEWIAGHFMKYPARFEKRR